MDKYYGNKTSQLFYLANKNSSRKYYDIGRGLKILGIWTILECLTDSDLKTNEANENEIEKIEETKTFLFDETPI